MSFDNSPFGGGAEGAGGDAELKAFLEIEGQKAKFQVSYIWLRCMYFVKKNKIITSSYT